ncbi:MAG: hypothetical protein FJ315_00005 [SAR202 cluster bacterium]|nr:hypothetical protein [SAR202 cluster bacterium]
MFIRKGAPTIIAIAAAVLLGFGAACGTKAAPKPLPPVTGVVVHESEAVPAPPSVPAPMAAPLRRRAVALPTPPDLDLAALTEALRGLPAGTASQRVSRALVPPKVGQSESFFVVDMDDRKVRTVAATLRQVSHNAYWYVEDGVSVRDEDIAQAVAAFEEQVLPRVAAIFGPKTGPPLLERLTVLHARLQGAAGYFSGNDLFTKAVHEYSNERPMLYMNTRAFRVGSPLYQAVLAHELQHAFHNDADPGEDTWVNEGLSELAAETAGFTAELVGEYADRPLTPLTEWPMEPRQSAPHYGAANLFMRYLFEHYGGVERVRSLVQQPGDSIAGIDADLRGNGYDTTFAQVFRDWLAANLLGQQGRGRYQYLDPPPRPAVQRTLRPGMNVEGELPQFGAEHLRVSADSGNAVLRFRGAATTSLLPIKPASGDHCWWGNRGDAIQPSMTRALDLRSVTNATLRFNAWFDLEEDWDFAYVLVSTDGGRRWDLVRGRHASATNPVGNSLGPGFTGKSGGWVQETIDLSPYAGRVVLLRFQYVTDEAINGHGLCLDDFTVPELGWADDAESDGGWQSDGFWRTDLVLPQEYAVQVVEFLRDGRAVVREVALDLANTGAIMLEGFGTRLREAVVIVSPMTAPTRVPAKYVLSVEPA